MTEKERKLAISTLNQEIQKHRTTLQQLQMLKSDTTRPKGNFIPQMTAPYINLEKIDSDINNLSITISDLITVRDALLHGKCQATIQGTASNPDYILGETYNSIKVAGLNWYGDVFSDTIWFD